MPFYPEIRSSLLPSKDASVFDSPVTKAILILARLMGADDPSGALMGVAGPLMAVGKATKPVLNAARAALPDAVRVQAVDFPNGMRYSVFPAEGGGDRLFHTKTKSALDAWLKKYRYTNK